MAAPVGTTRLELIVNVPLVDPPDALPPPVLLNVIAPLPMRESVSAWVCTEGTEPIIGLVISICVPPTPGAVQQ